MPKELRLGSQKIITDINYMNRFLILLTLKLVVLFDRGRYPIKMTVIVDTFWIYINFRVF